MSAEKQAAFLAALEQSGNVEASCRESGASKATMHRLKDKDPQFAAAWLAAVDRFKAGGGETVAKADDAEAPPDIDDLVDQLEEQIVELEAERKKAQADFPKHALAAQLGPSKAEHKAKADALRATISRAVTKIEELRVILAEATKARDEKRLARHEQRKRDVQAQIAPLLEQRDKAAAQLEKMLAEVAVVTGQVLQLGQEAWHRTRAFLSIDQGYACQPEDKLVMQAIAAALVHSGALTLEALEQLSPVGMDGQAVSPGLRTVVANQKMLMLSRLPAVEAAPPASLVPA